MTSFCTTPPGTTSERLSPKTSPGRRPPAEEPKLIPPGVECSGDFLVVRPQPPRDLPDALEDVPERSVFRLVLHVAPSFLVIDVVDEPGDGVEWRGVHALFHGRAVRPTNRSSP